MSRRLKLQEVLEKLDGALPSCTKCKYSTRRIADTLLLMGHKYDQCTHPKTHLDDLDFNFCCIERKYHISSCGPEGRLFERKSSIVRRVLQWIEEHFSE